MVTDPLNASPSPWVERFAPLVATGGTVLDVACGGGRHCRVFLDRDHPVTGIDQDIDQCRFGQGAELIAANLEDGSPWPLPGRKFDAVVVTNFLWRPLFPTLVDSLMPGGVLIYETFARGNEAFGRPRNPDHLLDRGELLSLAQGLTIVAYEDGILNQRAVVQRLCAVKGDGPFPLP